MLLVSLVNEDGENIEEKLLSVDHKGEEEEGAVSKGDSDFTASPEPTTLTVCVTFVSIHGLVYGHNVSPG